MQYSSPLPAVVSRTMALPLCLLLAAAAGLGCGRRPVGAASGDAGSSPGVDAASPGVDAPSPDAPRVIQDFPPVCTSDGWCWTHPLPTSDRFVQAFAVEADDLWVIGASGTILRLIGGVWSTVPSPTNALATIWASGPNDVLVGGLAGLFRWDGQRWEQVPISADPVNRGMYAIWGCAPNDVWSVGPTVFHRMGTEWTFVSTGISPAVFRAVWGSACNDVWFGARNDATGAGRIMHWNGSTLTETATRPAEQIAGVGPDDVWSRAQAELFHWSGLAPAMLRDNRTSSLFPIGSAAVGTLNDAHEISVFSSGGGNMSLGVAPSTVSSLLGRAVNDIWGLGALGDATHWNGTTWTTHLPGAALTREPVSKVTGSGQTDLWAAAGGTLLRGDGSKWETALTPEQVGGHIFDIWAPASNDVWVLGGDALIHRWNGGTWSTSSTPPLLGATDPEMHAISGTGPGDVWIVRGTNSVLHWDGDRWTNLNPFIDGLKDVWAAGPNEAWVVGAGASHWSGDSWHTMRIPPAVGSTPFTAVGGTGPTDVWLLAGGYVLKANVATQTLEEALYSSSRATALAPRATGGVWVAFQNGTVASNLYPFPLPPPTAPGPVLSAPAGVNDLWLAPNGTMWAAGPGGALIRRPPFP